MHNNQNKYQMKQTDIDRLKAICEKEGFHFDWDHVDHSAIIIREKKDPWEGVEFCQEGNLIYRIHKICDTQVYYYDGLSDGSVWSYKKELKPSTESAYIEQLKKEAFERFGEIKDGDRFENPIFKVHNQISIAINNKFEYSKNSDMMWIGGVLIYQSGKWAKKLPERVKVEWLNWHYYEELDNIILQRFELKNISWCEVPSKDDIGNYLAKCLEEYLNKKAGLI